MQAIIIGSEDALPLMITPIDPSVRHGPQWFFDNASEIRKRLSLNGALLFRNFDIASEAEFRTAISGFGPLQSYACGTSPRTHLGSGVYTSTEYPHQYEIALHNEMSYSSRWPQHIFFYCAVEPLSGGETPIADSRQVLSLIPTDMQRELDRRKIMYRRNFFGRSTPFNSWKRTFETEDKGVVEQYCRSRDMGFAWREDDCLTTTEVRPATNTHPTTGEKVWFNQAHMWHISNSPMAEQLAMLSEKELPMSAYFGDGQKLDKELLVSVRTSLNQCKRVFQWRQGDLLFLDNMLVAHGRMPFSGARKILVAMS
jgi:alpha-ketoglutarate-dependent taurine dioxygenase